MNCRLCVSIEFDSTITSARALAHPANTQCWPAETEKSKKKAFSWQNAAPVQLSLTRSPYFLPPSFPFLSKYLYSSSERRMNEKNSLHELWHQGVPRHLRRTHTQPASTFKLLALDKKHIFAAFEAATRRSTAS